MCDAKQEKIFKYTLESLYSFLTKSFVIIILSLFLHTFKVTFLSLVLYSVLRGFTFGIHATKNIYCWIISLSVYIILPLVITLTNIPIQFIYVSYFLGLIAILLWAPADTKARPLLNKKKRITNKIISFVIACIYVLIASFASYENFKEIVAIILLLNLVCMCPITYYIFKLPYRNYRFYKK